MNRFLRSLVVVLLVGLPVWVSPDRAGAAGPDGWSPLYADSFADRKHLDDACRPLNGPRDAGYLRPDEVSVTGGNLMLGMRRRSFGGLDYTVGGIACGDLAQQWGCYQFVGDLPMLKGVSTRIELAPPGGGASTQVQVGAFGLHVENGAAPVDKPLPDLKPGVHDYVVVWEPTGLRVIIDGAQAFIDVHPPTGPRVLSLSVATGDAVSETPAADADLPVAVRIDQMFAWTFAPQAAPDASGLKKCGAPIADKASPAQGDGGHWKWWLGGVGVITLLVVIVASTRHLRSPRKLRPGHRA